MYSELCRCLRKVGPEDLLGFSVEAGPGSGSIGARPGRAEFLRQFGEN